MAQSELDRLVNELRKYMDLGKNKAFPQTGSFKGRPSKLGKQQLAELERAINNARTDMKVSGDSFAQKSARNRALLERFANSQQPQSAGLPSYMARDVVPTARVVDNIDVVGEAIRRPEFVGRSVPLDVPTTARVVTPNFSSASQTSATNYPLVDRKSMDAVIAQQKDTLNKLKAVDKVAKDVEKVEKAKASAGMSFKKAATGGALAILGGEGGRQIGSWAARNLADVFTDDQGTLDTAENIGAIAGGVGGMALNFIPAGRIANVASKLLIPTRAANIIDKGIRYGVPTIGGASFLSGLFSDPDASDVPMQTEQQSVGRTSSAPSESELQLALRNLVEVNRSLANAGSASQKDMDSIRNVIMPNMRAIYR